MNKSKIDIHNTISPIEASCIIKKNVQTILENPSLAKFIPPIMLRGAPGVGKSTIVKAVADELGIGFIDIRLSQMEPVDLRGLPVPDDKTKTVNWYVTSDLPSDQNSKGILLFDELTSADRSLQVASYELILDRRLGSLYKVPDGWYIVACGNRVEDRAVSTTMSSALANRMMHFDMEANAEEWGEWALTHDIDPSVTGYIKYRPGSLFDMDGQNLERGWPSPRSWERVSSMVRLYGNDEHIFRKIVYGLVGNKVGLEYLEFFKINKKFADILEMMLDANAAISIPEKADELYAMCSSMQYLLWRGKNEKDQKDRIDGFMRICCKLPADFATMTVSGAMVGSKTISRTDACKFLYNNSIYKEFLKKHMKNLQKHWKI